MLRRRQTRAAVQRTTVLKAALVAVTVMVGTLRQRTRWRLRRRRPAVHASGGAAHPVTTIQETPVSSEMSRFSAVVLVGAPTAMPRRDDGNSRLLTPLAYGASAPPLPDGAGTVSRLRREPAACRLRL